MVMISASKPEAASSMIPESGEHFSEWIMPKQEPGAG
jgi:hypothetical protein